MGQPWISDLYTFMVAREAIRQLLDRHAPAGEFKIPATQTFIQVPPQLQELSLRLLDPAVVGGTLANSLIVNLQRAAAGDENPELDRIRPYSGIVGLLSERPSNAKTPWNEER
jgi:hypothetical protein